VEVLLVTAKGRQYLAAQYNAGLALKNGKGCAAARRGS
jgi:hypothetical protein